MVLYYVFQMKKSQCMFLFHLPGIYKLGINYELGYPRLKNKCIVASTLLDKNTHIFSYTIFVYNIVCL